MSPLNPNWQFGVNGKWNNVYPLKPTGNWFQWVPIVSLSMYPKLPIGIELGFNGGMESETMGTHWNLLAIGPHWNQPAIGFNGYPLFHFPCTPNCQMVLNWDSMGAFNGDSIGKSIQLEEPVINYWYFIIDIGNCPPIRYIPISFALTSSHRSFEVNSRVTFTVTQARTHIYIYTKYACCFVVSNHYNQYIYC